MARMTEKEKRHRAMLKPYADHLATADERPRGALVTQIREIAIPELLLLLGEMLTDRARRTSRPEVATGAMSGLV